MAWSKFHRAAANVEQRTDHAVPAIFGAIRLLRVRISGTCKEQEAVHVPATYILPTATFLCLREGVNKCCD